MSLWLTVGVEWITVMDVLNLNAMWYIIVYKKTILSKDGLLAYIKYISRSIF